MFPSKQAIRLPEKQVNCSSYCPILRFPIFNKQDFGQHKLMIYRTKQDKENADKIIINTVYSICIFF